MPRPVTSADELWNRALALLARRSHARGELERKLRRYQPAEAWVSAVLDRLTERGLLDDARFAADLTDAMVRGGRSGPVRIQARLRGHGLSASQASEALEGVEADWRARALALARQKVAAGLDPKEPKGRAKLARLLASRGYSSAVVYDTLRALPEAAVDDELPEP